jgi:TolA-binding protein
MWGKVLIFGGGLVAGIIAKMIHNEAKSSSSGEDTEQAEPESEPQVPPEQTQAEKKAEQAKLENNIQRMKRTLQSFQEAERANEETESRLKSLGDVVDLDSICFRSDLGFWPTSSLEQILQRDRKNRSVGISTVKTELEKAQTRLDQLNAEMDSEPQTVQEVPAAEPEPALA